MLIEGLKDGTIDMIATDHAPTAGRKGSALTQAQRHTGTGDCPGPGNHQSGEAGTSHAFGAYGKDEL